MAPTGMDSGKSVASDGSASSKATDWAALRPKHVDAENAMNPRSVALVWQKMMQKAGLGSASELDQKAFHLAVYVYACKNGTSREGNYAGTIVTSTGHVFQADVIPYATGKMNIRRFFRGNMEESYHSLKKSESMEQDEAFIARMAGYGVSAECAFATADWLADCPFFTPAESSAHNTVLNYSLARSRRARGGKALEAVEGQRLGEGLEVQGALNETEVRM